jgi:hypothetical protein
VERIAEAEAQVESLSTLRDSKLQRVKVGREENCCSVLCISIRAVLQVLEKERTSLESAKIEAEALLSA